MSFSVIIPTFNEAARIATTIESVRAQRPLEIIVADGGSEDGTALGARHADVVLSCERGRAGQMNAGAARARGECLLFLHSDCVLEAGALAAAERCLRRMPVIAGCFRMCVDASGPWYRALDWCATARVKLARFVYGDQGLFLRRRDFERLGGFPRVRFMEDVLLSKMLRRLGRIEVVEKRIVVSPRRWQKSGLVRQTLRNWTLTALAAAGVDPDRLAGYYPHVR